MTREEYLANHDAHEGAEEPETVPYLKPCPFCGGEATLEQYLDGWRISCDDCDAEITDLGLQEDAVFKWNRRA
ncbi:MAG: Lar family restriction alleviation protein [Oscillospiraceae bacterium]|nr:Lar family restriction alleviation protein [Oscillospiraceae bacterium]